MERGVGTMEADGERRRKAIEDPEREEMEVLVVAGMMDADGDRDWNRGERRLD